LTIPVTSRSDYRYLRELVLGLSRNVLEPAHDFLFDTRLDTLLRNRGMTHLHELVLYLRSHRDPDLERSIAEAMTINETSFFRDSRPFDLLCTQLLPRLIEQRRTARALRFWSAACSTGQEAYSLAIALREHFHLIAHWNIRIEGTDLCADAVRRAQAGRYHRIEINRGLPARYLVRYFEHRGEDWVVRPEVRGLCTFRQANLCTPSLPFCEPFDVIFLRNVMLYFSKETRRALLARIHSLLAPDGVLFLGSSEQTIGSPLWTPVLASNTCYFTPRKSSA